MKTRFASAYASAASWQVALEQVLRQLPRLRVAGANLGFVYFSEDFAPFLEVMLARLREATGVDDWLGSSAVGVLGDRGAALDAPGLSLLLGRFPADSFHIFSGRRPLPRDFAAYGAIVHADPTTPDMADLVQDMASKVRAGAISGGLASGRSAAWQVANDTLSGGLSGVAFNESVRLVSGVAQGCMALGGSYRVTDSDEHDILRLNSQPALDVLRQAANLPPGGDVRRAMHNILIGLTEASDDRRLYTVRRINEIDVRRGALTINEALSAGQNLIFVRQDEFSARDDLQHMLQELREACPTPPKGGLYISCLSRGGAMFERDETEVEMIAQVFGDLPVAGFFAAGEIAGKRLFGYTGLLTLFL